MSICGKALSCFLAVLPWSGSLTADELEPVDVEGQPLAANVARLIQAYEFLGTPLPPTLVGKLGSAIRGRDPQQLQRLLDPHVLCVVDINPESRVKARRGPARAVLQQGGFSPLLIKVVNQSTVTKELHIRSPQGGPLYAGASLFSLNRQQQPELNRDQNAQRQDRFLVVRMFHDPPMTRKLNGLEVEYAIALIYCSEKGQA